MRALILIATAFLFACNGGETNNDTTGEQPASDSTHQHASEGDHHHAHGGEEGPETKHYEQETHLKNVRQLTYGGNNAEAYWSFDNSKLVFQSDYTKWGLHCDQIFLMNVDDTFGDEPPAMMSTGSGRTTCAYFMPGDESVLYASTHLKHDTCPAVPPRVPGGSYVWPIYAEYDIFVADLEGNIQAQLTEEPGYDAEATVSPNGDKIVFTSTRSGDLELWTMDMDGSNKKQITDELGYDGGAFFSPDGSKIVWRASRPKTAEEQKKYTDLLANDQVEPSDMELYVCNADGSDIRQVTHLGGANWAPFFHPSGEKILFCSNHKAHGPFPFNLFMTNLDGTEVEQITFDTEFDSFPMFSYDGKYLVWGSNRNNGRTRDTNLFLAEWVD